MKRLLTNSFLALGKLAKDISKEIIEVALKVLLLLPLNMLRMLQKPLENLTDLNMKRELFSLEWTKAKLPQKMMQELLKEVEEEVDETSYYYLQE